MFRTVHSASALSARATMVVNSCYAHATCIHSLLLYWQAVRVNVQQQQKRFLNIHEYLSVDLLRKYGVNAPRGQVAKTPQEALDIAKRLGMSPRTR